ncbi:MAG: phosphatidate cytidylyltransferase [Candidatus Malihini olakiniferum]
MLKYRLITAFILIPLVIAALFMLPPGGFAIVTLSVCMLAAWEWGQFAGLDSSAQRLSLVFIYGALLTLMALSLPNYYSSVCLLPICISLWVSLAWWCATLLLVLSYPVSAGWWRDSKSLRLLFGVLTIVPFFWGVVALRKHHYDSDPFFGAWWLLYVMLLVWGADSGAYFFGKFFGKHKLVPKVSPEKTWEGFIGGLATSAVISLLFNAYAPLCVAPCPLIICSIISALASVLGDLTESMFKREAGIKDSSHLIPGHGGVLDRIDSLTAAIPVFACLIFLVFKTI